MDDHVVVIGYGTKGRSAVETLDNNGVDRSGSSSSTRAARRSARRTRTGWPWSPATRPGARCCAGPGWPRRRQVIITTDRDDSTVLATLNVRQLNPDTYVVAAVRESDNVQLVRQSGADSVVTSSDAVGRLLGLSSLSPTLGSVMEDLLTYGEGLEVAERDLLVQEVGKQPQSLPDQVIAVVRDGVVHRYFDPAVTQLVRGDRLVVVRPAEELPWAPRPGTHGEASPTRRTDPPGPHAVVGEGLLVACRRCAAAGRGRAPGSACGSAAWGAPPRSGPRRSRRRGGTSPACPRPVESMKVTRRSRAGPAGGRRRARRRRRSATVSAVAASISPAAVTTAWSARSSMSTRRSMW